MTTPIQFPLRILLVTARPEGKGFVDSRSISRELVDELQRQSEAGMIELEFLRPPTFAALRDRLKDTDHPIHVLHFDGHGGLDDEAKQGSLLFETNAGKPSLVKASHLAQLLSKGGVRLAILTACQSAMNTEDDAFSSVSTQLINNGLDAVIAMSSSILVTSAALYAEAFYHALAEGFPVSVAQEQARQALHKDPHRHLLSRRQDEEAMPVTLVDWWLPHFYQQRPLTLHATTAPRKRSQQQMNISTRFNDAMPSEPRYHFSGRARELLQIERHLLRKRLVVLSGFGGVGKTALACEAADWLTRTGMYACACFVSFEYGGDASLLLSMLGIFLGVNDGNYQSDDPTAALESLKPALRAHPTLVIADNMESILPGGEAPLESAARDQLWDVLLELVRLGAGVLLTSRDTTFGDGQLAPGIHVAHLPLRGLWTEDAYALATRLMNSLSIERIRVPYAELRDLLDQLDQHPLAIQLVLPALRTIPLTSIRADFAALLPQLADEQEDGRNRSLLASLEYSLQRLSEAQRALLPRLAIFEGGANEGSLLRITEIPESEWLTLRLALEKAALLRAESIDRAVSVPFLYFHPVLMPFLRGQPGAKDGALRERFISQYASGANYLYDKDKRNPRAARATAQRELPNLRRALEFMLEAGDLEAATEMSEYISRFLTVFGRYRERDELRLRVATAAASTGIQGNGAMTREESLRERGLGEDEFLQGNYRAAETRFLNLLARIEALPEGAPLGHGSHQHRHTLHRLACCFRANGQLDAAEQWLNQALAIIDELVKSQPADQNFISERGILLTERGNLLRDQGQYWQAHVAYEEGLKIAEQLYDLREQAVVLGNMGTLAQERREYGQARDYLMRVLGIARQLHERAMEFDTWHNLGGVAQKQEDWGEAERCYRESLALKEQIGDAVGITVTCGQLANVAEADGRPAEAEGWYKRAIELGEQVHPRSLEHAIHLNNFTLLLLKEMRAGRASLSRLAEAQGLAEHALAIREAIEGAPEAWGTLGTLAEIAELGGRAEEARTYRRRERDSFAAFPGNRYHIDRQHDSLIEAIISANNDMQAQEKVEALLQELETDGWHITAAVRRIGAGERNWHALVEGMDRLEALLVLRVLEAIALSIEAQNSTLEELFASLPPTIREALEREDGEAYKQASSTLSPDELLRWKVIMPYVHVGLLDPLLWKMAIAAVGSNSDVLETHFSDLEEAGWQLRVTVQRICAGERSEASLAEGMDVEHKAIVHRLLEIITLLEERSKEVLSDASLPPNLNQAMGDDDRVALAQAQLANIIHRQLGAVVVAIAAAAKGSMQAQLEVEVSLPALQAEGWNIATVVQRIWAGERDLPSLTADLDIYETLLVRQVLETLTMTFEQAIDSLPAPIREALEYEDPNALEQVMGELSPDERLLVVMTMAYCIVQRDEK